ncbi:MAG: signal recognition particle protein [Deltaproteobacteria bacterium]|nr:signal recognition particle protein [Deltaproteobacteria bacterium]
MFENLTDKLEQTFKRLRGHGRITEANVAESLREVRTALLEADVNFQVVKSFTDSVRSQAMGQDVLQSLTPDQQLIKIVRGELIKILGGEAAGVDLKGRQPVVLMLVGLQGSGKTTTAVKLALHLKKQQKRTPYLVSADVYRPGAREQLRTLCDDNGLPVYDSGDSDAPLEICRAAVDKANQRLCDVLIVDTAGRLQIDEEMMQELVAIRAALEPRNIILTVDAMIGQDAVNQAQGFNDALDLTGTILTKMDGDARGGAALSVRSVVGKPVLYVGVGEKADALEPFFPDRMASRILGMGDVLSLIEKAEQAVDRKAAPKLEQRMRKGEFTLEDFQTQMQAIKKMGSIGGLLDMVPGGRKLTQQVDMGQAEKELKRVEAIINSMTLKERRNPALLNGSRRRRIADGSGTTVTDVNRLMKQYMEMRKMMQRMKKSGGKRRGLLNRLSMPFQ